MDCLEDAAIQGFLERTLSEEVRAEVTVHLDTCAPCRLLLADVFRSGEPEEGNEEGGARDAPGRYVLLSTLGAGGMGVVEAAFDRELDRKVALKFLSATPGEDATRARARLQREAQALAKLAHPNVVTVHDVGVLDGEVFVAMELVVGMTLRAWLARAPRALSEIVGVLRQAGEGLAAAHAAGLVHRDFKPDNVLVGDDGRVRVTDFGLAQVFDAGEATPGAPDARPVATLTRTGVRAGTPAYMSPEQRLGEVPGARSDIYSYCVTLHEAVTGARPGNAAASKRRAPAWLERAVARGLSQRPEDRWPSMRALLDVLARGPRVTPARVMTALATVTVIALLAVAAVARERAVTAAAAAQSPPCPAPAHAFDGVWDDAQRAAVERAFTATQREGAASASAYVTRKLDDYRDAWARAEVDTCAATRVRGEQSEHLLDLRMACLDDRRRSLGRTVALLAGADVDIVANSAEMVTGVPSLEPCNRVRSLEDLASSGTSADARVVAAGKLALDDGRALFYAGKLAEARARVEPAIAEVTRLGYAPLLGQLLYWRANIERDLGLIDECEQTLTEAAVQALEGRDDATLAQVWTLVGLAFGGRRAEARARVEEAGAAIRRLGGDDALEGERLLALGSIESSMDRGKSRAHLLRARDLLERTRGSDFYLVASVDQRLGNLALDDFRMEEAAEYHARSLALRTRLFGLEHSATISCVFNVAEDAIRLGRPAEAREGLRALGAIIAHRQPGERAWYAYKLGDIARLEGDASEALAEHESAMAFFASPDAAELRAVLLREIGRDLLDLRRPRDAVAALERAVAIDAPRGDADAADDWFELGRALWESGHPARARELVGKARAAYVAHPDATDPTMLGKADAWLASHGPAR